MAGGRYSQLKELTLKVEQEVNSELSTDHFVILRLCQLICAFKERDVVAFNSLYRSSVRSFEKRGVYDDSLKMFCTGLNACRKDNDRNRRQMFEEFVNYYSNHTEHHTLLFHSKDIFVIWAAAESKGISVEEWYKNYNNQ